MDKWLYINLAARASRRRLLQAHGGHSRGILESARGRGVVRLPRGDRCPAQFGGAGQRRGDFAASIQALKTRHLELAQALVSQGVCAAYAAQLERDCQDIAGILQTVQLIKTSTGTMRDVVAGYGEIWSTHLFAPYLKERGRIRGEVQWVDARDVVMVEWGSFGPAVQWAASEKNMRALVPADFTGRLIVTGFIATTISGSQTTLGRNGSDFSGSIFGALLDAAEIIIWTDVDGVLTADPRRVPSRKSSIN